MKLTVLMWKHMKARYRHYTITLMELLFPILILCFAYLIKKLIYNFHNETAPKMMPSSIMYQESPRQVLYYPSTEETNKLMDLVGEKLNLSQLITLTVCLQPNLLAFGKHCHNYCGKWMQRRALPKDGHHTSGLYGIINISKIDDIYDTIDQKAAIVIFEGFNNQTSNTLPKKLNYTIKMKNRLKPHTNILEEKFHTNMGIEPLNEAFLSLQWAIDQSYISMKNGLRQFQDISIEPLANAKYLKAKIYVLSVMHIFCFMSMGVVFMVHVSRVIEERVSGAQVLISMAGVSPALYNLSHLLNALLFSLIYTAGVVGFLVMSIDKPPMLQSSDIFLVALMVFMYYVNTIAMGFFTCYLLSDTRHIMSSSAGFYGLSYLPSLFLYKVKFVRPYLKIMFGLLPHVPLDWFWGHLAHLEAYGSGLNTISIVKYNESNILQPYVAYVMMLVQFVVFSLITFYFSLVRPGKFGTPLPWGFMFEKAYWFGAKVHCDLELIADLHGPSEKYHQYFQPRPLRRHIGIRIVNVSKIYAATTALQKITLNIQRGEIYVLLGHNGAGKTTLLNIITGVEHATTGKVYVNGLDVSTNKSKIKKSIGICPQENIFIPELTVIEHLMFFTMIRKDVSFKKARFTSGQILKQLKLDRMAENRVIPSSEDVRRRLQIGCAMAGETDVLILDEPTSGLDVETRRKLWELLLSLKSNRTVLLTTHFMEEADALGDRVAALHVGRLRCDATPMYLKNAVGKGYRLTLMTIRTPNVSNISARVFSEVPEASFKEVTMNCITFDLPSHATEKFSKLFEMLEENRDELSIQSIGIGTITLEEVFLRLCSDVHVSFRKGDTGIEGPVEHKAKGLQLYKNQLMALWQRQIQYRLAHKFSFLLLEFIIPVFMLAFLTYATNALKSDRPSRKFSAFSVDLVDYNDVSDKKVLIQLDKMALRQFKPKFEDTYNKVDFVFVSDLNKEALRLNTDKSSERGNIWFGIHLNETYAKILYSTTVRNSAPVALNLLSNMLAERLTEGSKSPVISTYIEPIADTTNITLELNNAKIKSQSDIFNWALFVSLVIIATVIHSMTPLSREQLSGTRLIFIIYGCSPILYWIFTWFYHTLFYIVTLIIPALVITMIFEGDETLDQVEFRAALCTILVVGLMAYLALMYLTSLYLSENSVIIVGTIFILVFGMVTPTCQSLMEDYPACCGFLPYIMQFLDYTIPPHTFTTNLLEAGKVARINALCKIIRKFCPNVPDNIDVTLNVKSCCATTGEMQCYFCLEKHGLARRYICGAVQSIVYMTLVMLSQMGIFNGIWDKLINKNYKSSPKCLKDPFILKEIHHVTNAIRYPPDRTNDVVLVQNLHKRYRTCQETKVAVQGISFSVKKGECFGIVGLAGSGKTTIMKMLAGAESITRGKIVCSGIAARVGRCSRINTKYLRTLGYCPEKHNLDDFRTGEDNLATLLKLRGYKQQDVKRVVENWIHIVSLDKQLGKRVWSYSGGCKRRLAAAAAMMAGGALTLLDDPTAAIDLAARKEVWLALSQEARGERASIVTSTTMQDMEALCDRVCILVDGKIKALATPAELRAIHDNRFLLQIYLNTDEETTTPESLRQIDIDIRNIFKCKLIDGHRSMLQYRVSRTLPYSDIFRETDQLRERYKGIILDYTIKEPMLEELFLTFAKKKHEEKKNRRKSWFRYM